MSGRWIAAGVCGLGVAGGAPAEIRNLDVSAFVTAQASATNTVNDIPFRDGDTGSIDGSGSRSVVAAVGVDFLGTAIANSAISLASSATAERVSVTFGWSGDGGVTVDNNLPHKVVGASAGGSVAINFEIVGEPALYALTFTSGGLPTQVTLSGGGVSLAFCANHPAECPTPEDNLPRSGTLPPGNYRVSADCGGSAAACRSNFPCSSEGAPEDFNGNFNLTLTVDSAPSFRWITSGVGDFQDAGNWESNRVPAAADAAIVDLGGQTAIDYQSATSNVARLLVRDTGVGLFGGTLQLTSAAVAEPSLAIGGQATLTLNSGELRCRDVVVGDTAGSAAAALELAGSSVQTPTLVADGVVRIGALQPGRLRVLDAALSCDALHLVGAGAAAGAELAGPGAEALLDILETGATGPATVAIRDGARLAAGEVTLGVSAAGATTLVIAGVDAAQQKPSDLTCTGRLRVGAAGAAEVSVRQGGLLDAIDVEVRPGKLVIDGVHATRPSTLAANTLVLGGPQPGELVIENGARCSSRLSTGSSLGLGERGTLRVRGQGLVNGTVTPSALQLERLHAGIGGAAAVVVGPAGAITLDELQLGDSGSGRATVTLDAADLAVRTNLLMAGNGSRLELINGARADFGRTVNLRAAQGELRVVGPDATVTIGDAAVAAGSGGSGVRIEVRDGGVVSQPQGSAATLQIGDAGGSAEVLISHPVAGFQDPVVAQMVFEAVTIERGSVRVEGAGLLGARGTLTVRDRLEVDTNLLVARNVQCDRLVIGQNGVLRCCPNGGVVATTIINEPGGRIEGGANVTGNLVTGGLVSVGCSPGTLTIAGDFEQTAEGTLVIEIGGPEDGAFDVLQVGGTVVLGGALEIRFLDGFLPRRGQRFDFLVADGLAGGFSTVTFPGLAAGFEAELRVADGKLGLAAMTDALPGAGAAIGGAVVDPTAAPLTGCATGPCGAGLGPFAILAGCALLGWKASRRVVSPGLPR